MIQPGELLDGYRAIRLIGSGGFGAVWLCRSEAVGDLRALKFIPILDQARHDREFDALARYRQSAHQLRSPAIMPIEHVNRRHDGLFYIMPLCDGCGAAEPTHPDWRPTTLAAVLEQCRSTETWLSVEQVLACITPVLEALQLLSDAGLVHRDVKPDNILFVNDIPCLADISLLGDDSFSITRRGTPGYSAPSWYVESGGQPDMYGAATTLYSVLTGNPPDKMGRSNFRWPPLGEHSLSADARKEWLRMHAAIRRAIDDRPSERFADFNAFARALRLEAPELEADVDPGEQSARGARAHARGKSPVHTKGLVLASVVALVLGTIALRTKRSAPAEEPPPAVAEAGSQPRDPKASAAARIEIQQFEAELANAIKTMSFPRAPFIAEMESIAADLYVYDEASGSSKDAPRKPIWEIKARFLDALKALPPKPDTATRLKVVADLREKTNQIGAKYGGSDREKLDAKLRQFEAELNTDLDFRKEQAMKVLKRATRLVNSHPGSWDIIRPAQNFSFSGTLD